MTVWSHYTDYNNPAPEPTFTREIGLDFWRTKGHYARCGADKKLVGRVKYVSNVSSQVGAKIVFWRGKHDEELVT